MPPSEDCMRSRTRRGFSSAASDQPLPHRSQRGLWRRGVPKIVSVPWTTYLWMSPDRFKSRITEPGASGIGRGIPNLFLRFAGSSPLDADFGPACRGARRAIAHRSGYRAKRLVNHTISLYFMSKRAHKMLIPIVFIKPVHGLASAGGCCWPIALLGPVATRPAGDLGPSWSNAGIGQRCQQRANNHRYKECH
jgi:hypothetical protein